MGCIVKKEISETQTVNEFLDSLILNIDLLDSELKKLSSRSRDVYMAGKRVLKVTMELKDTLEKIESFELNSTNWEIMRDNCDICFKYYYSCYSSLNGYNDDEMENKFGKAEKKLKQLKNEASSLIKK